MFRRDASAYVGIDNLSISGPEMVDDLRNYFSTQKLLGEEANPDGLAPSLVHGRRGEQVDAIGPFQPGVDAISNLELRATYASGRPHAKKVLTTGSPHKIHVVIDAPERTKYLEGLHTFRGIGRYTLALSAVIAEAIDDAELRVYHSKEPNDSGLLYEGDADNIDIAYSRIEDLEHNEISGHSLSSLLDTVVSEVDPDNDATVLLSDFMDEYNEEFNEFSWEKRLTETAYIQEDLLRIARVTSPSHTRLPHGVFERLDEVALRIINENYKATARAKELRINSVIDGLLAKTVTFGIDETNPSESIMSLLRGETEE